MSATAPVRLVPPPTHTAPASLPAPPVRREERSWPAPLPLAPTPLFGRDRETELLCKLVSTGRRRLVTLTGPGGVGKTRLALRVATALSDHFGGDIAFVSLAQTTDPSLLLRTIALTLGIHADSAACPIQAWSNGLAAALRDRETLLILDNLEQIVDGAPALATLLTACPDLRILTTSRIPLRLSDEQEFPAAPLPVSRETRDVRREQDAVTHVSRLASHVSDAVTLFTERARAVQPGFHLTDSNSPAVYEICRRLDGLPLAIELAAARIAYLPPAALLARLERRLPLLTGGPRDAPPRQRTMRDAIAWSVGLLDEHTKTVFARLGIFAGGWTLEAAEAVAGGGGQGSVLDAIGNLIDSSLVHLLPNPDQFAEPRYTMLETIREYARELLHASGLMEETTERLTKWLVETNAAAGQQLRGPDQVLWLARLEVIQPDVRAALRRLVAAGTPQAAQTALRLCTGAMWFFWNLHARQEDQAWLGKALAIAERDPGRIDPGVYGRGLTADGMRLYVNGAYDRAITRLTAAAEVLDRAGDRSALATAYGNLGNAHADLGDFPAALDYLERSIAIRREIGEPRALVTPLVNLVATSVSSGDLGGARRRIAAATPVVELHGDPINRGYLLCFAAEAALYEGILDEARELLRTGHEIVSSVGEVRGIALADMLLAMAAAHNDLPTAQQSMATLALILAAGGQDEGTTRIAAAAEALRGQLRAVPRIIDQPAHDRMMATLRASLPRKRSRRPGEPDAIARSQPPSPTPRRWRPPCRRFPAAPPCCRLSPRPTRAAGRKPSASARSTCSPSSPGASPTARSATSSRSAHVPSPTTSGISSPNWTFRPEPPPRSGTASSLWKANWLPFVMPSKRRIGD